MDEGTILSNMNTALVLFALLSLPPLVAALIVGLTIGVLQAATQIQDQTLPQTFKLLAVVGVLILLAPLLVTPLLSFAEQIFTNFPALTR